MRNWLGWFTRREYRDGYSQGLLDGAEAGRVLATIGRDPNDKECDPSRGGFVGELSFLPWVGYRS